MKVGKVQEICDCGEFVSIITITGTIIHLPSNEKHSITLTVDSENDVDVKVDFNEG
jgi:hypothetical protein